MHRGNPELDGPRHRDVPKDTPIDDMIFGDHEVVQSVDIDVNDPLWKVVDTLVNVNRNNGFVWTRANNDIPCAIALAHSELSEALEEDRHRADGWEDRLCEELGDAVIRCLDLAGQLNLDVSSHIVRKIVKNSTRGHKHGGKRY